MSYNLGTEKKLTSGASVCYLMNWRCVNALTTSIRSNSSVFFVVFTSLDGWPPF